MVLKNQFENLTHTNKEIKKKKYASGKYIFSNIVGCKIKLQVAEKWTETWPILQNPKNRKK